MKRKYIPNKIRATLQKEIKSKCPFCDSEDVEHFEFHHIDGNIENNEKVNLIFLCPTCHSKIGKGDISLGIVKEIKAGLSKTKTNLSIFEIAELEHVKLKEQGLKKNICAHQNL